MATQYESNKAGVLYPGTALQVRTSIYLPPAKPNSSILFQMSTCHPATGKYDINMHEDKEQVLWAITGPHAQETETWTILLDSDSTPREAASMDKSFDAKSDLFGNPLYWYIYITRLDMQCLHVVLGVDVVCMFAASPVGREARASETPHYRCLYS